MTRNKLYIHCENTFFLVYFLTKSADNTRIFSVERSQQKKKSIQVYTLCLKWMGVHVCVKKTIFERIFILHSTLLLPIHSQQS